VGKNPKRKRMKNKMKYEKVSGDIESGKDKEESLNSNREATKLKKKSRLTFFELFRVLSPYFWPAKGSDGVFINRVRSTSTWIMVASSKVCNLTAPFYISLATNYLVDGNFVASARCMASFSALKLSASIFKELQTIMYVKVKQQASIQLQELTFTHLHTLSLNWHLSKKTGSVMKSMDRGQANYFVNNIIYPHFLAFNPTNLILYIYLHMFSPCRCGSGWFAYLVSLSLSYSCFC
jgi:hypothetical protein